MPPTIGPSAHRQPRPGAGGEPARSAARGRRGSARSASSPGRPRAASSRRPAGGRGRRRRGRRSARRRRRAWSGWRRAKLRILNRPRSSIGWRARASWTRKSAKQATPTTIGTQTIGSPQPWVGCSIRAKTGPPRPTAESADAGPVDAAEGVRVAALLDRVQGQRHGRRDQRQVDPEDRPPGEQPDQGAAAGRADHGRDPGPGGPGADRLAARRRPRRSRRRSPASPAPAAPRRSPAAPARAIRNSTVGASAQSDRGGPEARSGR